VQFACIRIEHLPVQSEIYRDLRLRGLPLVLATNAHSKRVVLDAAPQAKGVVDGMPLAEALSICKGAVLVEPDQRHYASVFGEVLDAIEGLGADVEDEGLGLAYVRISGLELLFGGQDRLFDALLQAIPAHLAPRVGVGGSKFAAFIASSAAEPGAVAHDPGPGSEHWQSLSIDLLPAPWTAKARLHGFGLHTLGQVAHLPIGALQSQLGPVGRLMGELARGVDPRPLVPRTHQETVEAALSFPSPTVAYEAIAMAADRLLARAFADPGIRGRFARVCTLQAVIFRAPPWQKQMVFRDAMGDPAKAAALIKHTLQGSPPPGPVEELSLRLSGITGEAGRQENLFRDVRRRENLKEALGQLRARLHGQPSIYHVQEVEPWSRVPERRQALVPYVP